MFRWERQDENESQPALFEEPAERHVGKGEYRGMEFLHVRARRVINEVPRRSPVPFRFTINAYRGCSHACTYCFARPTHEFLGMDSGADFERRIVVKVNAVERARAELSPRRWAGDHIAMGTNTDPYQRCEGKYRLTRGIVAELSAARNPFSILTKSTLILRDLDLLAEAARRTTVRANFSIGTLDAEVWRATEPGTPHPRQRIDAIARLRDAGVSCGVLVAPILPGLSDRPAQIEEVVKACVEAGAVSVSGLLLHLRPGVREPYLEWLARARPDLLALHDERYPDGRAYAAPAEQRELSALIGRLVGRHGGRSVAVGEVRFGTEAPAPSAKTASEVATATPKPRQLGLPL